MALAGVGQHFSRNFDQYTIMCVFGSVVGCVVLPLMAQSLESLIITAILFGVTVKTLNKNGGGGGTRDGQAEERKKEKRSKKTTTKRHVQGSQQNVVDGETLRQQRELDIMKRGELRELEKEQRSEEKRKKKAKKREERLQRREEERIEKEKQEALFQQLKRDRDARKKCKQSSSTSDLPLAGMDPKPLRRERQHSTSSSGSSVSTYSSPTPVSTPVSTPYTPHKRRPPPRQPKRASSAPLMTATPPQASPGKDVTEYAPQQVVSNSACSSPSSYAPVQMFHVLPILPFLSPQRPHPHFMYGTVSSPSHMDNRSTFQSYQYPSYNWSGQVTNANSANVPCQVPWVDRTSGHMIAESAYSPLEHGSSSSPKEVDPPSFVGTSGPAQGFYSFLNDQATTSDLPGTSSSNIWTPPSSSLSQGEAKGEWPDWFNNSSTLND